MSVNTSGETHRTRMAIITIVIILLFFAVTGAVSTLITTKVWDGGFPQAEYRLCFQTEGGEPLEGVSLTVFDADGKPAFGFPVSDSSRDNAIVSDSTGVMSFHHVRRGLEYGGTCSRPFFFIQVGKCDPPTFYCRFVWQGHSAVEIPYADLADLARQDNLLTSRTHWRAPPDAPVSIRRVDEDIDFPIVQKTIIINAPR